MKLTLSYCFSAWVNQVFNNSSPILPGILIKYHFLISSLLFSQFLNMDKFLFKCKKPSFLSIFVTFFLLTKAGNLFILFCFYSFISQIPPTIFQLFWKWFLPLLNLSFIQKSCHSSRHSNWNQILNYHSLKFSSFFFFFLKKYLAIL